MAGLGDLTMRLGADTAPLSAGLASAKGEVAAFKGESSAMGGALTGAAVASAAALVAVGVAAAGLAVAAGQYETLTTQLVTGAGESVKAIDSVRQGMLDMAGEVGISPDALAKGMYLIESAGYHGAAGLEVLKTAAEGASVGGADMATVSDAVTSALNAYQLPATDATKVTNDLVATVATGKMHMEDLAANLGKVPAPAAAAGVSLADVSGALATMTMQGTPAAQAATYLRQMILALENPNTKAVASMTAVGLTAHDVGISLGQNGLGATLTMVTEALGKKFPEDAKKATAEFKLVASGVETADEAMANLGTNTSPEYIGAMADMLGGTRQMMAGLELTGPHLGTFKDNVTKITAAVKDNGDKVAGWDLIQGTFAYQWDETKAKAEALVITWGTKLLPVGGQVAGFFSDTMDIIGGTADKTVLADTNAANFAGVLQTVGGVVRDVVLPNAIKLGTAVFDTGRFFTENLVPPMLSIAHFIGPTLGATFEFVSSHAWLLEAAAGALLGRLVAIKALEMGTALLKWVGGIQAATGAIATMNAVTGAGGATGALGGMTALFKTAAPAAAGLGTAAAVAAPQVALMASKFSGTAITDLSTLGRTAAIAAPQVAGMGGAAATTGGAIATMSTVGIAAGILGIAALGAGALLFVTDAGGMRTAFKNAIFGQSIEQAFADAKVAFNGMHDDMVRAAGDAASMEDKVTAAITYSTPIINEAQAQDRNSNAASDAASAWAADPAHEHIAWQGQGNTTPSEDATKKLVADQLAALKDGSIQLDDFFHHVSDGTTASMKIADDATVKVTQDWVASLGGAAGSGSAVINHLQADSDGYYAQILKDGGSSADALTKIWGDAITKAHQDSLDATTAQLASTTEEGAVAGRQADAQIKLEEDTLKATKGYRNADADAQAKMLAKLGTDRQKAVDDILHKQQDALTGSAAYRKADDADQRKMMAALLTQQGRDGQTWKDRYIKDHVDSYLATNPLAQEAADTLANEYRILGYLPGALEGKTQAWIDAAINEKVAQTKMNTDVKAFVDYQLQQLSRMTAGSGAVNPVTGFGVTTDQNGNQSLIKGSKAYDTGGFIRGGSYLSATLGETQDEWVVNRTQAGTYAPLLDAMISGRDLARAMPSASPAASSSSQSRPQSSQITQHVNVTQANPSPADIARELAWHMGGAR